jgi:HTH-type transcriptional regulator/antitoxin HigA
MANDLKPIRTQADYETAMTQIEHLWGAKSGTPEGDRLDVLATLVEAYEAKHYPIDPPDPIDAIRFRMEQQGLTRKQLEPMIGTRARVSEVLNGQRNLTLQMIRRLHVGLGIPTDILIRPRRAARAAAA